MSRYLKYALLALMWTAVAAYIVYAATSVRRVRKAKKVAGIAIEVVDSTSQGHLVSAARVRSWIAQSNIRTKGVPIDRVDLTGLEQLIARNGFVDRVVANVNYDGIVEISISQRRPIVRLIVDGMNGYATADGYVFDAPRASSLYVPVVTGSYKLPFPASYTGNVRAHIDACKRQIDKQIDELEREKYPLYKREIDNDRELWASRRKRVKRRWWKLESSESFDRRIKELREEKVQQRRSYRYQARLIQEAIDRIGERQNAQRREQKKLEKSYEDFMKLLTFVSDIESDDFWKSEIVQITARSASSGALELELTPRSGRHTILFGRIEQVDEKFDKLLGFYRNGLSAIGWSEYKTVDIRYKDQVVCKK